MSCRLSKSCSSVHTLDKLVMSKIHFHLAGFSRFQDSISATAMVSDSHARYGILHRAVTDLMNREQPLYESSGVRWGFYNLQPAQDKARVLVIAINWLARGKWA